MKTSTLTGADLNRAVAMSLGLRVSKDGKSYWEVVEGYGLDDFPLPNYAGDIAAAWPIIAGNEVDIAFGLRHSEKGVVCVSQTYSALEEGTITESDCDPLVAAMRCFVASVYGDEIDLEN